jgi:hypothetical protein
MPIYLYAVEPPGDSVLDGFDAAAEYIASRFPSWPVVPKIERCRYGLPLCRRPVFSDLLLRLWTRDRVVLPSPIVLYGVTEHELKSFLHGMQDRRVRVDVIRGDQVESTEDLTFVPWLLDNWAAIERGAPLNTRDADTRSTVDDSMPSSVDSRSRRTRVAS